MPDRWRERWSTTMRLHRRLAVTLSSAVAALLLLLGGFLFASGDSRDPAGLARPDTAVSSRSADLGETKTGDSPENGDSTAPTTDQAPTTTVAPDGSNATTTVTTSPGPTTAATPPPAQTTVPVTSPTTIANATTTTTRVVPTNGPQLPSVNTSPTYSSEDPSLILKLTAGDKDGYVSRITIDWDDQTQQTVFTYPLSACVEPVSSLINTNASHKYATAGSYTVTVTVTSVSCAGDAEQNYIGVTRVSVGGDQSPPVTSSSTTAP